MKFSTSSYYRTLDPHKTLASVRWWKFMSSGWCHSHIGKGNESSRLEWDVTSVGGGPNMESSCDGSAIWRWVVSMTYEFLSLLFKASDK